MQAAEDPNPMTTEPNLTVFQLAIRDDGVAVVTIDLPGESQNTLKAEFVGEANALLDRLEQNPNVQGVVFISGKPGSFIAGADINMLKACQTAAEATELSRAGQRFYDRLENFKAPVATAPAWAAGWNWRWPATAGSAPTTPKPRSACRK